MEYRLNSHTNLLYKSFVILFFIICVIFIVYQLTILRQTLIVNIAATEEIKQVQNEHDNFLKSLSSEIDALTNENENLKKALVELAKIYAINTQTDIFSNSDSILAEMYERTEESQKKLYADDDKHSNFYGRLYIPDALIDVALYNGIDQSITDRKDSANIFIYGEYLGWIIADHNFQEFHKLFSVKVGTDGYIVLENGDVVNLCCIKIINGRNTEYDLLDEDGISVIGKTDYLMYTCMNGWQNVRICLWEKY